MSNEYKSGEALQNVVTLLNILLMITGFGIIRFGVYLLDVETQFGAPIPWYCIAVMFVGCVIVITTFIGCFGAITSNYYMLIANIFLLVILFGINIRVVIKVNDTIEREAEECKYKVSRDTYYAATCSEDFDNRKHSFLILTYVCFGLMVFKIMVMAFSAYFASFIVLKEKEKDERNKASMSNTKYERFA